MERWYKRPKSIEVIKYTGHNYDEIADWATENGLRSDIDDYGSFLKVYTKDGSTEYCHPGDYVVLKKHNLMVMDKLLLVSLYANEYHALDN